MKKYIFIGTCGALGAAARYLIKEIHIQFYSGSFPVNTLIINITGSFVLALVLTIALEVWEFDTDVRLGIAAGFLGAYTTFSTLCKETVILIQHGSYPVAIAYVISSSVLGLAAVYLGVILVREVIAKLTKSKPHVYEGIDAEPEGGA